jgi:NADPH:quinone reductase-like Zn-dependent oxidoreductase
MKAVRLHAQTGPEAFVYEDVPEPSPQAGELLVRVHATAVTPTELLWPPTWQTTAGQPRTLPIPGHEFSGVIAAVGAGINDFAAGDAVYGMNDWFADGADAEYTLARATDVALKPHSIDHATAAVVPISALTAWQALVDRAGLSQGQRVLIHGGAGGVGSFAVQIARRQGARVIATASAYNLDFVRELGADEVIDYKATRFEEVARDLDVVLDTVGGETFQRSRQVLKPGGKLVSIAADSEASGAKDYFFIVEANRAQLAEIARLIDGGQIRPVVDSLLPLAQAREAYARKPRRGKVVLQVVG